MLNQQDQWNKLYKNNLRWNRETKDIPKILSRKTVLELGVGNGKTLKSILSQKPKRIIALDFSSESLKIINKEYPNIRTINSNITSIPLEDNHFDVVMCYFTLNNLLKKDRVLAIKEIYRVLKNKGVLLFQDFSVGDFRQRGSNSQIESNTIQNKNGIICHFFEEEEIKDLLKQFKSIKIKTQVSTPIKSNTLLQRKTISVIAVK